MGVSQIIIIATVVLTGLSVSGCKRNPVPLPTVETNTVPVATNVLGASAVPVAPVSSRTRDLGVVQLTNHFETRIQLGGGKSCTITPHLIKPQHLQLTMVLNPKWPTAKPRG